MTLEELNQKLKNLTRGRKYEQEMWRYIQDQLQGVILYYQNKQLFEDSIGSDNKPLGFYGAGGQIGEAGFVKVGARTGKPFTMVSSGEFKDGIVLSVNRRTKEIHITSTTDHLDEMLESEHFLTTEFFGLTYENVTHLVNLHIKPHMDKWLKQYLEITL